MARSSAFRAFAGAIASLLAAASTTSAQWDPASRQWGKEDPRDLRVMTWNVQDGICSTNDKVEGNGSDWAALARIVAAMRPDVLVLQETGDNAGNGSGSGVDGVLQLGQTVGMFLYGGADHFRGGVEVTSWVQKYAPAFDLPFVFVSTAHDNFNRNIILSRYPFADLNGDTRFNLSDIPTVFATGYAPGGNGGIRGFAFAEIDLPDADYAGDLVIGNAHLKSGGTGDDLADRLRAAQNVAYYVDYLLNGAGTGSPDPNGRILDSPAAQTIIPDMTPVILAGDWNEDELNNGRRGPAEWLTQAATAAGTDGTDRDRTDATYDDARHVFTSSRATFGGSSKLDYIAWQDSIATLRRAFIFNTSGTPTTAIPVELMDLTLGGTLASGSASDHRPVIADFILPEPVVNVCTEDLDGDGAVGSSDLSLLLGSWGGPGPADFDGSGMVGAADLAILLGAWGACP